MLENTAETTYRNEGKLKPTLNSPTGLLYYVYLEITFLLVKLSKINEVYSTCYEKQKIYVNS